MTYWKICPYFLVEKVIYMTKIIWLGLVIFNMSLLIYFTPYSYISHLGGRPVNNLIPKGLSCSHIEKSQLESGTWQMEHWVVAHTNVHRCPHFPVYAYLWPSAHVCPPSDICTYVPTSHTCIYPAPFIRVIYVCPLHRACVCHFYKRVLYPLQCKACTGLPTFPFMHTGAHLCLRVPTSALPFKQ